MAVKVDQKKLEEHRKRKGLDPKTGKPVLDPRPMAPPIGYKKQPSIFDQVRQAVRAERLRELEELEETLDQVDDYDIADDPPDPMSKWENDWEPTVAQLRGMIADKKEAMEAAQAAQEEKLARQAKGAREAGDQGDAGGRPRDKKSGGTGGTPDLE